MSSTFAQLMKVAEQNARDSNREVLEAARRREEAQKAAREQQERKEKAERELQKQMLIKRKEDAEKEEQRKREKEILMTKRREEMAKKREEEAALPRKSNGVKKDDTVKKTGSSSYVVVDASALTREEKRRLKDPIFSDKTRARLSHSHSGKRKQNSRLPGGAINATDSTSSSNTPSRVGSPASSNLSARARIVTTFTPTLTKLNTSKRDMRTIDEITRDLKRKQLGEQVPMVLSGDQARSFDNWFGKKEPTNGRSTPPSPASKGEPIPMAGPSKPTLKFSTTSSTYPPSSSSKPNATKASGAITSKTLSKSTSTNASASLRGVPRDNRQGPPSSSQTTGSKRPRPASYSEESDSLSEEDRRYQKDLASRKKAALNASQRDMIWQLMGRDRSQYVNIEVDSDDDMEVTGADLEREERESYRIARREDAEAEAEERRHEAEKKRRKLERERALREAR